MRIFGPHGTAGAFSTFINFEYYGGVDFQLALGDTIAWDGSALIGAGVGAGRDRPAQAVRSARRKRHAARGRPRVGPGEPEARRRTPRPRSALARLASLASPAWLAGCDADAVAPVPVSGAPTNEAPSTPSSTAPPPRRRSGRKSASFSEGNGFGLPADNLLADGDFELSTVRGGYIPQLAWIGFNDSGERAIKAETGGLCRTGLRCGVLEPDLVPARQRHRGAADEAHIATVWAKPPEGSACDVITIWSRRRHVRHAAQAQVRGGGPPRGAGVVIAAR